MQDLEVQCKPPFEKFVEIQQVLSAQALSLDELKQEGAQGKSEMQRGFEDAQASLTQLRETLRTQSQAFEQLHLQEAADDRLGTVFEQLQGSRAELASVMQAVDAQGNRLQSLASDVGSQQQAAQAVFIELKEALLAQRQDIQRINSSDTQNEVASVRTTVDTHTCQLKDLAAEVESHHQAHLQELRDLKASLATQAECDGLKLELQASRRIQENMAVKEKSWEAERNHLREQLAKLDERERELIKQLQEDIVTMPPELPAADLPLKESQVLRMGRLGGRAMPLSLAALAVVFVVGMVLRSIVSGQRQALRRAPGRAFLVQFNPALM